MNQMDLYKKMENVWEKKAVDAAQVVVASFFLGLCAQVSIPLYFSPVPLTLQTLGVMLVAAALGSRKGASAVFLYLLQGCLGAPVWAGGSFGPMVLLGPTGGYLMAYPLQAYWIGKTMENSSFSPLSKYVYTIASVCAQLAIGSCWLSQFVGIKHSFLLGFFPFFLGECLKGLFTLSYVCFQSRKKQ